MATFRNVGTEPLIVGYGLPAPFEVEPDATVDVPDDVADSYDANDNFIRVDTPAAPEVSAPEPE